MNVTIVQWYSVLATIRMVATGLYRVNVEETAFALDVIWVMVHVKDLVVYPQPLVW